jgi:pseudouridine 5'-phosphatase
MRTCAKHVYYVFLNAVADTEDIYTKIFDIIASRYGKKFTWELKVKQMGKKLEEAAQVFIGNTLYISQSRVFLFR